MYRKCPSAADSRHLWPRLGAGIAGGHPLLGWLLGSSVVLAEDWAALGEEHQAEIEQLADPGELLQDLLRRGLLTEYQARRIASGQSFGLVLGNYRILDHLGGGATGAVYRAEHTRMRRAVAVKTLMLPSSWHANALRQLLGDIRTVARLQHPNIVAAIDCGEQTNPDAPSEILHYLVTEYVPGQDLESLVAAHGPLSAPKACELVYQVASALDEAHRVQLVHRDVKPSNVRVTPDGQVKLLDFGLASHLLGSAENCRTVPCDYIAPEQADDPASVDLRVDIFGLGGLLYWCLTGEPPRASQWAGPHQPPPPLGSSRPDLPRELERIIGRMLAADPQDRFTDARTVMRALQAFFQTQPEPVFPGTSASGASPQAWRTVSQSGRVQRILIVDDEPHLRTVCRLVLQSDELAFEEASNGTEALQALQASRFDLVLLDIDMPGIKGPEVLRRIRSEPPSAHLKVIMFSGRSSGDDMADLLLAGADDYVTKPFSNVQLQARVRAALRLKEVQDRGDLLNHHLLAVNAELEHTLGIRDSDLIQARNGMVLALAKLAEHRDSDTGTHLLRLQRFCRCLAEQAADLPNFAGQIDGNFIRLLECCAPLHDIGKVGLPDHILLKPGTLTTEERRIMQAHTIIGSETLAEVARQYGFARAFLQMAIDIARHHHERWDGAGYPDRLAGESIPLSARIVALADVYDALRSRRVYKPGLPHAAAVAVMAESQGQFDPSLLHAFQNCSDRMDAIYSELTS